MSPSFRSKGYKKGSARNNDNQRLYANPLPILFHEPLSSGLQSVLGLLGLSLTQAVNPQCEGYFDLSTRSVWISNRKDTLLLWRRGFFGKGNLSRSEPSWLSRQISTRLVGGKQMTSEEVTAKRRADRRQFKLDRAAAITAVATEAENIFETEGRVVKPALSGPAIPSAATWQPTALSEPGATPSTDENDVLGQLEPLNDIEHLQLTLQEAFFLAWNLDCLTIIDPRSGELMSLKQLWTESQAAHLMPTITLGPGYSLQFDNPYLVNYVVYHHYRSLGWVVKTGIKFCVDYLLYKRGPVFAHAEFAVVVCPVYEDPEDQRASLLELPNSSPFSWSWLSTINRVNSQVQKTLVLAYVTIPARTRLSIDVLDSPACLQHYSVREVILRRFIPARMRD